MRIKRSGQRATYQPVPLPTGREAAGALGLKLVAAINGRLFFANPVLVPVRYRAPRRQFVVS
jgi:hypothetical protein